MKKLKFAVVLVLTLAIAGCVAASRQKFQDQSEIVTTTYYDSEGNVTSVVSENRQTISGRNIVVAPPVGAQAVSDQQLDMSQEYDEETDTTSWSVNMGSVSELEGGDITAAIEALEKGLMQGVLEAIKGGL